MNASVPIALRSWRDLLALALMPMQTEQGVHIDPLAHAPPDRASWSPAQASAWSSPEMAVYAACFGEGGDVRTAILRELADFTGLSPEACRQRCLHWEADSIAEWKAADRSTPEGLRDFYNSQTSWLFDLAWYSYLQVVGHCFPASVVAAQFARAHCAGRRHLDFGSGIGATSQLFARLGFETTLADVSKPLLDFARWRLARHGEVAETIDMNAAALPSRAFDCITALDTLVHVPDFEATVRDLHRALRPDGWLLVNFDVRARDADASAWHLHGNAIDLDTRLQACGFRRTRTLGTVTHCYHRVEPRTVAHAARRLRNRTLVPLRLAGAVMARLRWPTPHRLVKLARHVVRGTPLTRPDSPR